MRGILKEEFMLEAIDNLILSDKDYLLERALWFGSNTESVFVVVVFLFLLS